MAEGYALEIERAVSDTHPASKGQREYSQQIKSLTFNLKHNPELMHGLLEAAHSPATLAVMTSEQLASSEMQRQTAEMRAKAEKQSILYQQETGPRVRRTHKGEEVVEDLTDAAASSSSQSAARKPQHPPLVKRESTETKTRSPSQPDVQHSPTQSNFDIGKVFSTVKSPGLPQNRRPSAPALNTNGPGFDPDVDRMLQDEPDSPPYSPTEESLDPDVVWKGTLAMSSIADFGATAKHVGGANFASFGPWSRLIPKRMTVAGRIPQQSAIEYLCSLRYSNLTDIVVVSIAPVSPESQADYNKLAQYFLDKKRYGVIGNKVAGNVRDTYLVPVAPGDNGHPEFMLNLVDNYIPKMRTEPLLLGVFVYRNEPEQLKPAAPASIPTPAPAATKPANPGQMTETEKYLAQQAGQATAKEVLGPLINVPTVQFLLPQAFQMSRREWEVIRSIYDKEPKARDDLQFLGALLEKEGTTGEAK